MSDPATNHNQSPRHPANLPPSQDGSWTIWTIQRTVPYVPPALGTHNYLAIADEKGQIMAELHEGASKGFTAFGPTANNRLMANVSTANGYLGDQRITYQAPVMTGEERVLGGVFIAGVADVAISLEKNRHLYDGAEVIGHGINSNSVWNTALRSMAVAAKVEVDPTKFQSQYPTPGSHVDLRSEPSNNPGIANRKPEPENPLSPSLSQEASNAMRQWAAMHDTSAPMTEISHPNSRSAHQARLAARHGPGL